MTTGKTVIWMSEDWRRRKAELASLYPRHAFTLKYERHLVPGTMIFVRPDGHAITVHGDRWRQTT